MKKLTALLLSIVLLCGTLMGCNQEDIPGGESTENEPYESTDPFIENILEDYDKEESQKGFTIKGKKYPYNDNDILILDVENTTATHYTAFFSVTFYDEAGNVVAKQDKTLEQFPGEYEQFCIFQPESRFASYTCELSVEEYTGVDYLSTFFSGKFTKDISIIEFPADNPNKTDIGVKIYGNFGPCNTIPSGKRMRVRTDAVVFDNTGKVYTIKESALLVGNTDTEMLVDDGVIILRRDGIDLPIPEELTGELTVILAPVGVELYDDPRLR